MCAAEELSPPSTVDAMTDEPWRGLLPETVKRATGSVFHYTSPAGLLGLLQNGELWATESTGMNDLAEVRQGWAFIREWLERQSDDEAVRIMRWAAEEGGIVGALHDVYMCCASSRGDDANQWRLYAHGGRGYAVELDATTSLSAIAAQEARPTTPPRVPGRLYIKVTRTSSVGPWLGVLYTDADKLTALDGLLANARREVEILQTSEYLDEGHHRHSQQALEDEIAGSLASLAQLMKADGFSGENEFRAVVTTVFDGISKFRPTADGVVRYVRLTRSPAGLDSRDLVYEDEHARREVPVLSVRSGPLLHRENGRKTLQVLLEHSGYGAATVLHSEIPLRP